MKANFFVVAAEKRKQVKEQDGGANAKRVKSMKGGAKFRAISTRCLTKNFVVKVLTQLNKAQKQSVRDM